MTLDNDDPPQAQTGVDEVGLGADWVEVEQDWWRCSFTSVDWTYRRQHYWTETGEKLSAHPRPPFYHDFLYVNKGDYVAFLGFQADTDEIELNASLPGVEGAEDVMAQYEAAVGMVNEDLRAMDWFYHHRPLLYGDELSGVDLVKRQREWHELVDALLGGILEPSQFTLTLDPEYHTNFWDLDLNTMTTPSPSIQPQTTGSPESIDFTDSSDTSLDSDSDPSPSTPYTDKKSYAAALYHDRAHRKGSLTDSGAAMASPSPAKPLNASALSFVPAYNIDLEYNRDHSPPSPSSDLPYISPTYEFHFPSLNKQTPSTPGASRDHSRSVPPPPPLQRDEQGFYNPIAHMGPDDMSGDFDPHAAASRSSTPRRMSTQLFPGFLADTSAIARPRSTSKTREIVDRLKSSAPVRRQKKGKGEGSSLKRSVDAEAKSAPVQNEAVQNDGNDGSWIMDAYDAGTDKDVKGKGEKKTKNNHSRRVSKEDWIQGLFQCRSPDIRPQTPSRPKTKPHHERSASTATASTTASSSFAPTTPSSTTSHLPSPATSISSLRGGPACPPVPPPANLSGFPPPYFGSFQAMPRPFSSVPGYPGPYGLPAAPNLQMIQMQQAQQWRAATMHSHATATASMYMVPPPPPMFVRR